MRFLDDFSSLRGRDDLDGQIQAAHVHLGSLRIERVSELSLCQGHALVRWEMRGPDGKTLNEGKTILYLQAIQRLEEPARSEPCSVVPL